MKVMYWILVSLSSMPCLSAATAQTNSPTEISSPQPSSTMRRSEKNPRMGSLDAEREKRALLVLLDIVQKQIVSAAEAMPADKYGFAPSDGEFKGVRTFGQQVKHLAATNYILAASAFGAAPPPDAGDELGPETVRTKSEILNYLNSSFYQLRKAAEAVGDTSIAVKPSPISPLSAAVVTRSSLIIEASIHAFDHYGQMVEYLRMNWVVPPASRP